MSVKVSGNFAKKLDRWAELLRDAEVIVRRTSQAQAEVSVTLVGEGFESEQDPYGTRWEPKKVDDGRKVLHGETSALRTGWHVASVGKDGFQIAPSVEYAAYHQSPRSGSRPQRMMVPSGIKGLPREWVKEFEAVALAEAAIHFQEAANGKPRKGRRRRRRAG
jgi:phage gpG-like protein